jgi:hypothetical protein
MFSIARALHVILVVALVATLHSVGAPTPAPQANEAAAGRPAPDGDKLAASPADLLQFRAGGHVLGFTPGRVYLAGLDHALQVEFLGTMNTSPPLVAGGSVGDGGPAGISPLSQITYPDLWPGISLSYEAAGGGIAKSTYHLAPGADPVDIQLRYNLPIELASDGSLQFQVLSGRGWLAESPPLAWQDIGGERMPVEVAFMVTGDKQVSFRVGDYDPRYPLTIDPTYQWHTFYGSRSDDWGRAIAVDASGNVYVTGRSEAAWQGDSGQSPLHSYSGDGDLVVVKLDSNGVYQWHTFYGSSTLDEGWDITIDASGNVYVTGFSYGAWQADGGAAPLHTHSGVSDLVVLKLDSSGVYQWHTFYGSSLCDEGRGISIDGRGHVYVTGISCGAWQGESEQSPLHGYNGNEDLVVLKLDSAGIYQWHTFYGSSSSDYGKAIAIDFSGDVYITGYSWVTWSGNGDVEPLHAHSGYFDLVVLKLDSAGIYQWHTFYGSSAFEEGQSITIDGSENVYVAGASYGAWQGDNGAHPLHSFNASSLSGYSDLVVLKLDSTGIYQWHTFYGSIYSDTGSRIAVDGRGDVTIIGGGQATWQGDDGVSPLHPHSRFPNDDLVVLKLDNSGGYRWHTFYGADSNHQGNGAIDSNSNVYATGWSEATWLEDGTPPLHAYNEGSDLVVMKLTGRLQLSVGKDGSGGGTVTSDPAGINCGYACSAEFDYGTPVTLTAVADTGSTFTGWGGACSGTGDCVVTMDAAKSVTATFAIYRVYLPLVMRIF